MTTWLGKILVFVCFALSLVMLAWALGIYTQGVNYYTQNPPKNPGDPPQGELYKRRDRLAPQQGSGLWQALGTAETRYKFADADARYVEGLRPQNLQWFDAQLKELEAGNKPVKEVAYKDGRIVPDKQAYFRPEMVEAKDKAGKPLQPLAFYIKEQGDLSNQIKDTLTDLQKATKEDVELTVKIGGAKGMRYWLAFEKEKGKKVAAELEELKPQLVNAEVDGERLQSRQRGLELRKAELEQLPAAPASR
jgi:hypothetical protein